MLASIYRHDIVSSLQIMKASLEGPEHDVIGVYGMDESKREDLYDVISVLDNAYDKLEGDDPSVEDIEEEVAVLGEYEGVFDEDIGERVDQVADLSECIDTYLSEYSGSDDEAVAIEDVMEPLEHYDVDVSYNGHEDALVEGDPGLYLVTNTIGANGIEHGKTDESYRMWGNIEEKTDSYTVEIWDNGPGIPDNIDRGSIFVNGVGSNTGKGLHLAKEIVESFDGSIALSNTLEQRENGFGLEISLNKAEVE